MIRRLPLAALAAVSIAGLAAAPAFAERTASAIGVAKVKGKTVQVEVFVEVPRGQSAREATDRALAEQGAKRKPPGGTPPGHGGGGGGGGTGGPGFTGLRWTTFPVVQSYNPAGQRVAAQSALQATQSKWSSVQGSAFRMSFGGTTPRCPSLVQECPGAQVLDGRNDVGWQPLSRTTLGVTWSTASPQEADMALNTQITWNLGCANVGGSFDAQTVLLHENGHVAGLDHATSTASIMYPSYTTARCSLSSLDTAALASLY